eukprot:tig00001628_g9433.t1
MAFTASAVAAARLATSFTGVGVERRACQQAAPVRPDRPICSIKAEGSSSSGERAFKPARTLAAAAAAVAFAAAGLLGAEQAAFAKGFVKIDLSAECDSGEQTFKGKDLTGEEFTSAIVALLPPRTAPPRPAPPLAAPPRPAPPRPWPTPSLPTRQLRGCDFSGAKLVGASFFQADVTSANFEGADLTTATFEKANVTDANFKNAVLSGSFWSNAILTKNDEPLPKIAGADFTDVILRKDVHDTLCGVASGTNPTTGEATKDTLYCD